MRIALVTETYVPEINGVAKTLARLAQELSSRGHDIHIIRPRQKHETDHHAQEGLTHVRGITLPGYAGLQFGLPANNKLYHLWKSETPHAVYVATEGPLGWSAVRIANKLGIPVLSGFHTNFDAYSRHYNIGWLKPLIFNYLKNFHNKTCCTLAPSPTLVERLIKRGISNTQLFSRGIDTTIFNPSHRNPALRKSWQAEANDTVTMYVGRISAEKNINLVIEAWHGMRKINSRTRLIMVGDGPLLSKLRKRHPDIVFCGAKTGVELSQYFASADVFLFASETETFGNVILEAMASELAVISFDYAAAQMHIRNNKNGLVAKLGDNQEFIESALKLAREPGLINKLRLQARNSALENNWQHVIDNFEKQVVTHVKPERLSQCNRGNNSIPVDGST